jgi:DNA-binding response OmpR family regulator
VLASLDHDRCSHESHFCSSEAAPCPGPGLRVLLADGDAGNAECMELLLTHYGHRVQIARSGPSALRLAQADLPDVVVLEIRLPGMDGWEVVRELRGRANGKRPFFIALTSCDSEADRRRSLEAGIDLHLLKPLQPRFLRSLLRRFRDIIEPLEEPTATGPLGRASDSHCFSELSRVERLDRTSHRRLEPLAV